MTATQRLRERRILHDLCVDCGSHAPVGLRCNACREQFNDRRSVAYLRSRLRYWIHQGKFDPDTRLRDICDI